MEICCEVRPDALPRDSICFTTSMPWVTRPKTRCLPSSQGVSAVVRKKQCGGLLQRPGEKSAQIVTRVLLMVTQLLVA
jgi:hypothetical protein